MKKIFTYVTALCLFSAPVAFTSCDEDDVKTALDIISYFIQDSSQLAGTAWVTQDRSVAIGFNDGTSGSLAYATDNGSVEELDFTYSLSGDTLTLVTNQGNLVFTVKGFTAGSSLILENSNGTFTFVPYTAQ